MEINVINIYKHLTANSSISIEQKVTNMNILIFRIIDEILYSKPVKKDIILMCKIFCDITLQSEKENINAKQLFNNILSSINDIYEEFKIKEEPSKSLCYLIGTNSELLENYTIVTRLIILAAALKFMNINLIFN